MRQPARSPTDPQSFVFLRTRTAEIEKVDPNYEKFAADLIAKHGVDALAAAGYDTDFAADSDPKAFPDRLQIWAKESNDIAIETYDKIPMNATIDQVRFA